MSTGQWVLLLGSVIGAPLLGLLSAVTLVLKGKLWPVSSVATLQKRYQDELLRIEEEKQTWRTAYERERDGHTQTRGQLDRILVVADTTERLMVAMRAKAEIEP